MTPAKNRGHLLKDTAMSDFEQDMLNKISEINALLRTNKPGDRSELDRHFAIFITELEKLRAIFVGLIIKKEIINE